MLSDVMTEKQQLNEKLAHIEQEKKQQKYWNYMVQLPYVEE